MDNITLEFDNNKQTVRISNSNFACNYRCNKNDNIQMLIKAFEDFVMNIAN